MSTVLTAELAQFAADVQKQAADLADQIRQACPAGHLTNEHVGYLTLAGNLLAVAVDETVRDGLHIRLAPEPTDLDTADPEDSRRVDELLRQYAAA